MKLEGRLHTALILEVIWQAAIMCQWRIESSHLHSLYRKIRICVWILSLNLPLLYRWLAILGLQV